MAPKKGNKTPVTQDERFKNVHNDPRFRLPKRNDFKVEVDDRFSKSDLESIKKKSKIDKYGRKIKDSDKDTAFSKYYKTKDADKRKEKEKEKEKKESDSESDDESQEEAEKDDNEEQKEAGEESNNEDQKGIDAAISKLDRARGEGVSDAESSSDESSSDEDSSDLEEDSDLEEEEEEKPEETDPSSRFAVVNLDWDHVKSTDLFATFQSFVPSGGLIRSISIYPSEFGKERLQREDIEGPPREVFQKKSKKKTHDDDDDDDEEEIEAKDLYEEGDGEEDYDSKSLRRYQLQRLRYYYAVVTCDSINTAKHIYDNCDGTEYESTANFFDLRFIPDEMEFDEEPRDTCTRIPSNYKPETFVTDALQHSKVKLTWDETPTERVKLSSKAFSQRELDDMDFKAYLASDNSDDDEEEGANDDLKNKYKNLVGLSTKIGNRDIFAKDQKDDDVDMEITFTPGLDERAAAKEEADSKNQEEESTIEKLKRKAKERRKQRKDKIKEIKQQEIEEKKAAKEANGKKGKKSKEKLDEKSKAKLELLMMDEIDDKKGKVQHFNLKELVRSEKEKSKKSKHRNKEKIVEDDFKADLNDPRFSEIFTNHDFAIDPSQPQFKKTATMQKILEERNKRRDDEPKENKKDKSSKKRKLDDTDQPETAYDVKSLVQKIKRKAAR